MQKCIHCHKTLKDNVKFCPYCGVRTIQHFKIVCPSCGITYEDNDINYCSQCGTRLVRKSTISQNIISSERKNIISLSDLVEIVNVVLRRTDSKAEVITKEEILSFCEIDKGLTDRYIVFYKHKKRKGRYRVISSPAPRLKLILRCLNEFLQTYYKPAFYVTGFVRNSSIVENGKIHVGQRFVFTIDLTDFFESVSIDSVEYWLTQSPFCFNKEIARTIASLSCIKNTKNGTICLSQGSPLSPILSNIVCTDMDKKLNGIAVFYGAKYSRYVDDITFSSQTNLFWNEDLFIQSVKRIIKANHFRINADKVHLYGPQSCHYITGVVTNEKINVPRFYIRSIRNLLYIWEQYGIRAAYKKHDELYQKKNKGKQTPFIGDFLRGQVEYLGTVRGKDDIIYLRFKSKLDALLAIPFYPFCGKYDYSTRRFGRVELCLDEPSVMKYGQKYFTAKSEEGEVVLISPKLYEYIESAAEDNMKSQLISRCSYYRIFDKDGVKIIMTKK